MYAFYTVKHGDQLFKILRDAYGPADFLSRKQEMIDFVKVNNPQIKSIDLIYPGQILALPQHEKQPADTCTAARLPPAIDPGAAVKLGEIAKTIGNLSPDAQKFASTFGTRFLTQTGTDFIAQVEKTVTASIPDLRRIPLSYFQKHAGTITANQYNYQRTVSVARIQKRLGFLEPLVFNTRKANEVLQVDRFAPNRVHQHIQQLKSFERIGKLARYGGGLVKAFDFSTTMTAAHQATKREDRIGILADYAGSVAGALVFTAVVGTPAGWVGLAAVALGGAVVSATAGALAETALEGLLAGSWKDPLSQFLD